MNGDGRSNHMGEEEEEEDAVDLNAEESAVGVAEEAVEEKAK